MLTPIRRFFALESSGGIVLAIAAIAAMIVANSGLGPGYREILGSRIGIGTGSWRLELSMLAWINDLLMAIFFFLVGLEIKREVLEGDLSSASKIALPAVAAVGGMVLPSLIYAGINTGDPVALRGWAIPAATDIAFALGALSLLGDRVPASLRVFVTAVAIIDDLGAIAVIAFFYTADLSLPMLGASAACCVVLLILNRMRVTRILAYLPVGLLLWFFVHESGVHATLAGVATALAIPMRDRSGASPVETAEHGLHPWVAYGVLPVFAFANAGVLLRGVSLSTLTEPIPLGIGAGLVAGKMIGVFGSVALLVRWTSTTWPAGARWTHVLGVALLCGIGFTMSLFIGGLAFEGLDPGYEVKVKIGVLAGSIVAGVAGAALLAMIGRDAPRVGAASR
ncbi:MAG: Na+/H+ antiporter NhaA [Burkholderiaceae bacterium]